MGACVLCNRTLQRGKVDHVVTIGEENVTVPVPADLCRACDESFTRAADVELAEGKVAVAIVRSGLATGPRFRFLRRFMGISAKDLAGLLKVAPETVSRWETGQREVDALAWLAMSMLVRDHISGRKDVRETLQAMGHPQRALVVADAS